MLQRLSPRILILLAAAGSAGLLLGAFFFQFVMGLSPCEMCLWQRWPHALAVVLAGAALALPGARRAIAGLGALSMAVSAGLALLHTGVERKWWEGITECSTSQGADLSVDQLLEQIMNAPVVRCDDVAWELLGLSMASWNGILSLGLIGAWALAAAKKG